MRWKWCLVVIVALLMLAGCNFNRETDEDEPTSPVLGTPVIEADTVTPLATATQPEAVQPTATSTLTTTPTSTLTITASVTATATASATSTGFSLPTLTPVPTRVVTKTPIPTWTPLPPTTIAPPPTFTPVVYQTIAPIPTFTPFVYQIDTPVPTTPPGALVCATCGGLNFRASPGTAGDVISQLDANTPLTVIGRTADNSWLQVVAPDGEGWVYREYLAVSIDLNMVNVTGEAVNAPVVASTGDSGVVSGVSSNARQIFLDGLAKGNIPYAFTRVGDSISASPNFLTSIGRGNYNLGNYGYLGGAISFFSGPNGRGANPFAASSIAAHNGWSTESVLNPANRDPGVCRVGETPLECEYRLVKPAVALIMFGTNDSGGMPAGTFQANLQTIVQKSINMGVIPVLSTIPPKHYNPATDGRIHEFNQIIIATARSYDIPLLDYYSAMAALPTEGLAPDGVHPSSAYDGLNAVFDDEHLQYGYPLRNFTTLQMLYTLWQQVLYDAGQVAPATAPPGPAQPDVPNGDCSLAPPPQLTVGLQGRITPGLPNKMRNIPGTGSAQVGSIPGEGVFNVLEGPKCADGYRWWKVDYQGMVGWTASGVNDEYWVEPYP